jgi:hypothetical protein
MVSGVKPKTAIFLLSSEQTNDKYAWWDCEQVPREPLDDIRKDNIKKCSLKWGNQWVASCFCAPHTQTCRDSDVCIVRRKRGATSVDASEFTRTLTLTLTLSCRHTFNNSRKMAVALMMAVALVASTQQQQQKKHVLFVVAGRYGPHHPATVGHLPLQSHLQNQFLRRIVAVMRL